MAKIYMYQFLFLNLFIFWMVCASSVTREVSMLTNIKGTSNVERKWALRLPDKHQSSNGGADLIILKDVWYNTRSKGNYNKLAKVLDNKQIQKGYELNGGGLKVYKDRETDQSTPNIGRTPGRKSGPGRQGYRRDFLPVWPLAADRGIPVGDDNGSNKLLMIGEFSGKHVLSSRGFNRGLDQDQTVGSRFRRQVAASEQITTTVSDTQSTDLSPLATHVTSASLLRTLADNTGDTKIQSRGTTTVQLTTVMSTNKTQNYSIQPMPRMSSAPPVRTEEYVYGKVTSKPPSSSTSSSSHPTSSVQTPTDSLLQAVTTKFEPEPETTISIKPETTKPTIISLDPETILPELGTILPQTARPEITSSDTRASILFESETTVLPEPEPEPTVPDIAPQPEPKTTIFPVPETELTFSFSSETAEPKTSLSQSITTKPISISSETGINNAIPEPVTTILPNPKTTKHQFNVPELLTTEVVPSESETLPGVILPEPEPEPVTETTISPERATTEPEIISPDSVTTQSEVILPEPEHETTILPAPKTTKPEFISTDPQITEPEVNLTNLETTTLPEPETTILPRPETTKIDILLPEPETTILPEPETTILPEPETTKPDFILPEPETTIVFEPETTKIDILSPEPETTILPEPETTKPDFILPEPETTIVFEPESTKIDIILPEPETTIVFEPETTKIDFILPEPKTTILPEPEITKIDFILPEPKTTILPEPEITKIDNILPEPETTILPKPETTKFNIILPEVGTPEPEPEPITSETRPPVQEPHVISSPVPETTEIKNRPSETRAPGIVPFLPKTTKSDISPIPITTESSIVSEPEPKSDTTEDFLVFAEPGPDWVIAMDAWKGAWDFLVYFYGVVFLLLGAFTVVSTVRLWHMHQLLSRHYFLTLNILISCVCVLRGFYLLMDAHNVGGTFHNILDYFLYSTVFPCLTSAFSILFYALLHATRMQVMSPKIQKLNILIGVIGFHFCFSFLTDITVGLMVNARILLFICQLIFVLWGLLLSISYLYLFRRLYKSALKRQKALMDLAVKSAKDNIPRYTLSLGVKVTFIIAICGLFCIMVELYGIFNVYDIFLTERPQPWPWWSYHFCMRTLEFVMCLTMAYVSAQPFKYQQKAGDRECLLYCAPFHNVLCNFSRDNSDLRLNNMERSFLMKPSICQYSPPEIKLSSNEKIIDSNVEKTDAPYNRSKVSMLVMEAGIVRFRREDELYNNVNVNIFEEKDVNNTLAQNGSSVPDKSFDDDKQMFGMKKEPVIVESKDDINVKIGEDKSPDTNKTSDASESSSVGLPNRIPSMNLAASLEWEFDKVFQESFSHEKDVDSVKSFPGMVHSMLDSDMLNASLDTDFSDQDGLSDIDHSPNIKLDTSTSSDSSSCDANSKKVAKKPLLKKLHRSKSDNPDIEDTKCVDGSKYKSLTTVDGQPPVVPRGFCVVEPNSKSNAIDELKRFSFYVNNKIS